MIISNVYCIICGVSFKISRVRRRGEPASAGWCEGRFASWLTGSRLDSDRTCREQGSCELFVTTWKEYEYHSRLRILNNQGMLHWHSIDGFRPRWHDRDYGRREWVKGWWKDFKDQPGDQLYDELLQSLQKVHDMYEKLVRTPLGEFMPIPAEPGVVGKDVHYPEQGEHIAGPGCQYDLAYSTYRIALEEMQTCTTFQCFVPKGQDWSHEEDDEDFEINGRYFLSGISDYMPSTLIDPSRVFPARHNYERPFTDLELSKNVETASSAAYAFHPSCLEVYKRASLQRLGNVDMLSLINWCNLSSLQTNAPLFKRHLSESVLGPARQSYWRHIPGDEFLAANPCFVPMLDRILDQVSHDSEGTSAVEPSALRPVDNFSLLPLEVLFQIILQLDFIDILNLRLSSRKVCQVPQSFFRDFVIATYPWLWEAWSSLDYSFWANKTSHELSTRAEEFKAQRDLTGLLIPIVQKHAERLRKRSNGTYDSEMTIATLKQKLVEHGERMSKSNRLPVPAPRIHAYEINWFKLCVGIQSNWDQLRGLRNRERIWIDCNKILDELELHVREGLIEPNVPFDLAADGLRLVDDASHRRKTRAWHNYCAAGRPKAQELYYWEKWVS